MGVDFKENLTKISPLGKSDTVYRWHFKESTSYFVVNGTAYEKK